MDDFRRRPVNKVTQPGGRPGARPQQPLSGVASKNPPVPTKEPTTAPQGLVAPNITHQPLGDDTLLSGLTPPRKSHKKAILWAAVGVGAFMLMLVLGGWVWYATQLAAVDPSDSSKKVVVIDSGSTPSQIAATLKNEEVIRSEAAFLWYTRLKGVQNNLQAGSYQLSPAETTPEIVDHLTNGRVDVFDVTLYPGATLVDRTKTSEAKKLDVTTSLKRVGYSEAEIQAGLAADYSEFNDTLFQGKPVTADLEGYIYGETYRFSGSATVEDVLRASFTEFWKVIKDNDLVAKYEKQGLTLYEGITLASIVQRESGGDDKVGIAQVFFSRYRSGEVLGSDVTYQYITDKLGVPRDINYNSPYNTRRFAGLPPGPIATPGKDALFAVGSPATTDYMFFLSGDDDVTYFARTVEEHEANIRNHCQVKCQII